MNEEDRSSAGYERKPCGKLTDHDGHTWKARRNAWWPGQTYWCRGWLVLDGGTRPKGNTKQFEEKRG